MNYKSFFNRILLEASVPTHELEPGAGANFLAGDNTDPEQLDSDLGVDNIPLGTEDGQNKVIGEFEQNINPLYDGSLKQITDVKQRISKLRSIKKYLDNIEYYKSVDLTTKTMYEPTAFLAKKIEEDPQFKSKYDNAVNRTEDLLDKANVILNTQQEMDNTLDEGGEGDSGNEYSFRDVEDSIDGTYDSEEEFDNGPGSPLPAPNRRF